MIKHKDNKTVITEIKHILLVWVATCVMLDLAML